MRLKKDLFIFLKSLFLGSYFVSSPGSVFIAKLNKIVSRVTFTILPLIQSHFRVILSNPVNLISFFTINKLFTGIN